MRIGIIGPVLYSWGGPPRSGGVSTYIGGLSTALAELGVDVSLLGDNTSAKPAHPSLQPPSPIHFYRMQRGSLLQPVKGLGLARLARIAVRLTNTSPLNIPWSQRLRYIDRATNYDSFLQAARPQVLHLAHAEFRQYLCQQIAMAPMPVVSSVLSATVFIRPTPDWLQQMTIYNYNQAARLLPCSNFVRQMIAPYVERSERMIVIPNGTDVGKFHPAPVADARRELGLDLDEFIVLFTGSLVEAKGVIHLLNAFIKTFSHAQPARLVFVGSGVEFNRLQLDARESGFADRVTLAGYQSDESMPQWYAACDAFALPSRSEGLSGSILEAMASGKPVITTHPDLGEHDAVQDGVNGFLVHYADSDALASALSRLFDSPELARRMGAASRKKAEQLFSWQAIARSVKQVYQDVLSGES